MHARSASVDRRFQPHSIPPGTAKIPLKILAGVLAFLQTSELILLSFVPQHCFAKDESERHLVNQRFQRARRSAGPQKIRMRPCPEIAMPVSAVMSLHAERQWISRKASTIERDFSGKNRVRVRRAREANPALVAQRYMKC